MSNKELRKALLIRYGICFKNRWYNVFLIIIYFGLGIMEEIRFMYGKEGSSYIIPAGVFAIVGVVAILAVEITRHERCQYIVPLSYEERKRYYLIGVLFNFTFMLLMCLLFMGITIAINMEYGMAVIKVFAIMGLPYSIVASFQKINMFKGKKKKDNPKSVYVSYVIGVVVGILASILLFQIGYLFEHPLYMKLIAVLLNVLSLGRAIYAILEIINRDTDYENVKVNQLKVLKKLM